MKIFDVDRADAGRQDDLIESGIAFVRWELRAFGLHFMTVYRQDVHIAAPPRHMEPTTYLRQWWFYPLGNWGFGLKIPVSVSRKLGLSAEAPACCANGACSWMKTVDGEAGNG